jgi:hypothetical protein
MGVIAVTSAANHDRIVCGQEWLKTIRPAEEVLIIGATLGAANEVANWRFRVFKVLYDPYMMSPRASAF